VTPLSGSTADTEGLAYIRGHYGVPATIGARFKYEGRPGTVVGNSDHYVRGKLDDEPEAWIFHPTWHMDWSPDA
jgi:hypothetical protein